MMTRSDTSDAVTFTDGLVKCTITKTTPPVQTFEINYADHRLLARVESWEHLAETIESAQRLIGD